MACLNFNCRRSSKHHITCFSFVITVWVKILSETYQFLITKPFSQRDLILSKCLMPIQTEKKTLPDETFSEILVICSTNYLLNNAQKRDKLKKNRQQNSF